VHVLGLFHPNELGVSASIDQRLFATTARRKVAIGDSLCKQATLARNGNMVSFRCGELRINSSKITFSATGRDASFALSVPGKLRRSYRGKLEVSAAKNELVAVVEMDLETAVASIVAAELPTDTPIEALKAQAVATRSFLSASARRHQEAEFCDTTHCQFLRSPPAAGSAAAQATLATRGLILTWQGKPFPAMYSASCGGTTRTLAQAGYRQHDYPYFAVECKYCRRHVQSGYGPGHGIGLCQHGAAGMAQDGADFRTILAHYFPNTELQISESQPNRAEGF
jgi:peptidoglycan hydrolase-like amidase